MYVVERDMARTSAMYTGNRTISDSAVRERYQLQRLTGWCSPSTAIVHPPLEQQELSQGHQQGHDEQAQRQAGADRRRGSRAVLDDPEQQRLGGVDGPAPGEDVHLGVRLEGEDHQHHDQEQQRGRDERDGDAEEAPEGAEAVEGGG